MVTYLVDLVIAKGVMKMNWRDHRDGIRKVAPINSIRISRIHLGIPFPSPSIPKSP